MGIIPLPCWAHPGDSSSLRCHWEHFQFVYIKKAEFQEETRNFFSLKGGSRSVLEPQQSTDILPTPHTPFVSSRVLLEQGATPSKKTTSGTRASG